MLSLIHIYFSWGIRIDPYDEVHARDFTSSLIEAASNYNYVKNNDFTHGGDGIFVRALNGMCSEYNVFEGNDTSFANNNAVECGMGRNYWYNNKANWSSFGFWMGEMCIRDRRKIIVFPTAFID